MIIFSKAAAADLDELESYLQSTYPSRADSIIGSILADIYLLEHNPRLGVTLVDKNNVKLSLRKKVSSRNIILYKIVDDNILIAKIVNEKTDYYSYIDEL